MSPTYLSSKRQLNNYEDRQYEVVLVPEWKENGQPIAVRVQSLTGAERDVFESESVRRKGKKVETNMENFRARLLVRTVVDEAGDRIFDDDDAQWLGQKSAAAISRIYDVAARLSGITEQDAEELTKNSSDDQSEGSTSDSPSRSVAPSTSSSEE